MDGVGVCVGVGVMVGVGVCVGVVVAVGVGGSGVGMGVCEAVGVMVGVSVGVAVGVGDGAVKAWQEAATSRNKKYKRRIKLYPDFIGSTGEHTAINRR
ncbi:MAG: hypothetical protein BroJett038_07670 [Chloroflexota bacterium]|nr:MAG: hypothetical protein BroJett038_07670 [Chloroflexota bacterium]